MNESVLFASEEKVAQHGCHDCASRKMYACAQGRKAYPNGSPDKCPPQKKTPGWRSCNEAQRSEESEFIAALLAENIRLKNQVAGLQEWCERMHEVADELERLRSENERLRTLLREAYGYTTSAKDLLPERIKAALKPNVSI